MSGESLALLFRQDHGFASGQRSGVCVFPEEFSEGHCSGYCLLLDQTNCVLCYQLSDEEAQTIHQVRAHDVRAFAASKAFQGRASLDQMLSACHWKAHNTFTQFYLKDLAWAYSELYHLGPVVAAQQIHDDK